MQVEAPSIKPMDCGTGSPDNSIVYIIHQMCAFSLCVSSFKLLPLKILFMFLKLCTKDYVSVLVEGGWDGLYFAKKDMEGMYIILS